MSAERKGLGVVGELASRRYGLVSNLLAILLRASKYGLYMSLGLNALLQLEHWVPCCFMTLHEILNVLRYMHTTILSNIGSKKPFHWGTFKTTMVGNRCEIKPLKFNFQTSEEVFQT